MAKKKDRKRELEGVAAPYMTNENKMNSLGIYPVRGRSEVSYKFQRRAAQLFILSIVALLCLTIFAGLTSSNKTSNLKDQVEQIKSPAFKSRYDSLGASIVESYFAGTTPPVNLLSQANWPNISENPADGQNTQQSSTNMGPNGGQPVEVKGLALIKAYNTPLANVDGSKDDAEVFTNPRNELLTYSGVIDGRQYEFGVYLIIPDVNDTTKLPYLVSPPTIMPKANLVSANIEGSKPSGEGFTEAELNEGTQSVLSNWASAYAQGDATTLKSLSGDGRVDATYPGVGGFTLQGTPTVEWSYQFEDPQSKENRIVARVSFTMASSVSVSDAQSGQDITSSGNDSDEFKPVQVMDILLGNFDEGVADIMAWGPGGTWQTLSPRMNSVIPVKINEDSGDQSIDNTTSSTTTPSTSGTDRTSTGVPGAPSLSDESSSRTTSRSSENSSSRPRGTTQKKSPRSTQNKSERDRNSSSRTTLRDSNN